MPPVPTLRYLVRRYYLDVMADQLRDAMRLREALGRYFTTHYSRLTDEAIDRVIQACDDLHEELMEQSCILRDFLRHF